MKIIKLNDGYYQVVGQEGISEVGLIHPNLADSMAKENVILRLTIQPLIATESAKTNRQYHAYVKGNGEVSPNIGGDPLIGRIAI